MLFFWGAHSQEKPANAKLFNDQKKMELTIPIDAINSKQKKLPTESIDAKNIIKIDAKAISEIVKNNQAKPLKQFVLEQQPKDKDIIVKKFWMGKDVTFEKLKSNLSLGAVNSKTNKIKIEFRDFGSIDGDRIRVYLNEKAVQNNVVLDGNYFFIYLNLENGFNRIDFQALNEGLVGPNTVELNVFDDDGVLISSNHWNLSTNEIATLVVTKN